MRIRGRENDGLDEELYGEGGVAMLQLSLGTAVIFSREGLFGSGME